MQAITRFPTQNWNTWDRPDEEDDIREELQECFADLQAFYAHAAEQGNAVLVMIC